MQDQIKPSVLEIGRIKELLRLGLDQPAADQILNEYVKKAAEEFDLPICLISIVLDNSQVFAASHGLRDWLRDTQGTPIEWSFCVNSIGDKKPFVVEDAENHAIVADNPLVTQDGIRCYAGVPMVTKNGFVIGNFCVLGNESREFSQKEINTLKDFAERTVERLEARVNQ